MPRSYTCLWCSVSWSQGSDKQRGRSGPFKVHPHYELPFGRLLSQRAVELTSLLMLLSAALLLPTSAVSQSQHPKRSQPRTLRLTRFYDVPQPLPPGNPGDLIRSESFDDYDLRLSVNVVRILYHSRSATGQDVAASGVVLFPAEKQPPSGGWPVIAWAHGSSGVARTCAPSLRRNLVQGPFLSMYVNLGYAVVATDYTGLGTKFRNAFLDAPSNAADLIASIPAARKAVPQLGSRWIVMGSAEGGLAALALAEKENELHDSSYLGAVVVSDVANAKEMFADPAQRSSSIKLASLAFGTKTVYPEFQPSEMLTEKGLALYRAIAQTCSGSGSIAEPPASEATKPSWDENKFITHYLDRSTRVIATYGPVLMISSDRAPSISGTIPLMCKVGDRVQWVRYPDLDPGRVLGDSVRDQIAWIESRFAGRPAPTNCGSTP